VGNSVERVFVVETEVEGLRVIVKRGLKYMSLTSTEVPSLSISGDAPSRCRGARLGPSSGSSESGQVRPKRTQTIIGSVTAVAPCTRTQPKDGANIRGGLRNHIRFVDSVVPCSL
jgi:hypothetical protein